MVDFTGVFQPFNDSTHQPDFKVTKNSREKVAHPSFTLKVRSNSQKVPGHNFSVKYVFKNLIINILTQK